MKIETEGFDKIYCYENSNVLRNLEGIKNLDELNNFERSFTKNRIMVLQLHPVKGNLDYKHLQNIHKNIFNGLYEWAGKERIVDIAKSNLFCRAAFLSDFAQDIFSKYAAENYIIGCNKEVAAGKLSYYLGEVNALHPFREGNGRTQREFIRCAALVAGYKMDWSKVRPEQMLEASLESFDGNYNKFQAIFLENMERSSIREHFEDVKTIVPQKGPLHDACKQYFDRVTSIVKDLKKNGLQQSDDAVHSMFSIEREMGREISVRELLAHQTAEGKIGEAARQMAHFEKPGIDLVQVR